MKYLKPILYIFLFLSTTFSQINRIKYNNQELFLSGSNLAWANFANDIGPGFTDTLRFADVMLQSHEHGGNALRWWLHTDGTNTPEFNDSGFVIGPGEGTITDLKKLLDLAWEREIGMDLCLWSFDMLRSNKPPDVLDRNIKMLTDTNYTNAYINYCLIPMVDSLKGHPGIITWEIFNEPEGMSNEFGWSGIQHVPMSAIQRFVNLCAGAIQRIDTTVQVTSGCWSFQALTDVQTIPTRPQWLYSISESEKQNITAIFNKLHNLSYTTDEYISYLEKVTSAANYNYYSDERLIAEGGDSSGTLDFYSVHYYIGLGSANSPFLNSASHWLLDKPILVAEFAMQVNDGTAKEDLFLRLYQFGYAGALPWSWTDPQFSTVEDMVAGMQYMWDNYREAVDVNGIAGEWPKITITSPAADSVITDTSEVVIVTDASDNDGYISLVEFFANDSLIGQRDTIPFTYHWINVPPDNYTLKAIATDNQGHQTISNLINIKVGTPPLVRLEAEAAFLSGGGMTVGVDPMASNGAYVNITTNNPGTTITWTISSVPEEGKYDILFGYKLFYDTPKEQFINVNGVRADTVRFEGNNSTWLEKGTSVELVQGLNIIQIQMYWGWMYLDYMAVPNEIVSAVVDNPDIPLSFSLEQNYPNPFNPVTKIRYTLVNEEQVDLVVYDILGRKIVTLVNEQQKAGSYNVQFDAHNLASGIYFYRIQAGKFSKVNKMMLVK